jgi:DNA-binding XRE family transcriptional regulator
LVGLWSLDGCAGALDSMVSTVGILSLWAGSRGAATPAGPFPFPICPLYQFCTLFQQVLLKFYQSFSKIGTYEQSTTERKMATMQAVVYIGDRLKDLRIRRALTQRELADRAGISSNALNKIELNKAEPHMSTLRKLAQALNVDPAELIGE